MGGAADIVNRGFYAFNNEDAGRSAMDRIEKMAVIKALERSEGNQIMAAKILGVHRNTLSNKIKKFNIDVGSFKR